MEALSDTMEASSDTHGDAEEICEGGHERQNVVTPTEEICLIENGKGQFSSWLRPFGESIPHAAVAR